MSKQLQEIVNTPESDLRHPLQLLKGMISDLAASRELAWRLFVRNISAKYRQTLLGYVWLFLPPIVTTLVWVFLNSQKILSIGTTDIPYPAYVMIGTLLWQGFTDAMNSPIRMVSSSKSLLAKINFPREALILSGLCESLFSFSIRLVLLIVVMIWFRISIHWTILLALMGVLSLMLMGTMIGIILTPLSALYMDIQQGLGIITSFWFFLTPVVYPPPTSWPASLLAKVNPVSPLLITTRDWLTTGAMSHLNSFLVVTSISFGLFLFGWVMYRVSMPHIIERMSA